MKVTGHQLREALKRWELKRDGLSAILDDSLTAFPGEEKPKPASLIDQIAAVETAIAALQLAQAQYNLEVRFDGYPLVFWVKRLGGYVRAEKLWKKAAPKASRASLYGIEERDPTKSYAQSAVTAAEAMQEQLAAAKTTSDLRAKVAAANAAEVALDVSADLFA